MRRCRIYENGVIPHFVTWTITSWLPVFGSRTYCDIITQSLTHCRREKGLLVHAYVIMLTHVHAILAAEAGGDLSAVVRDARKFTAKEIVRQLGVNGNRLFDWVFRDAADKDGRPKGSYQVWQPGTHPEALVTEKFARQKLDYIHSNPVDIGLVSAPEHWWYSSAGFYVNGDGPMEIDPFEL